MATANGRQINFAYVSYVGTNDRDIVSITNIKNFDLKKHQARTKYKIKWNDKWYYGTIAFFGETEEEVMEKADKARPKIIPEALLLSNTDADSDEAETQQMSTSHKKKTCSQSAVLLDAQQNLQNKLTQLTAKQNSLNETSNIKVNRIHEDNDTQEVHVLKKKSLMKTKNIAETVKISQEGKIKQLETDNRALRNEVLELKESAREFQILNMSLQRDVINKVGEMSEQLSKLLNRPVPVIKENESDGYPEVAFVRNSDNSVHIGRNIWLRAETYDSIIFKCTSPSVFVKDMAVAVFGFNVLKSSSVTGKISNRNINKKEKQIARPKLDATKLLAIEDIFRHWLKTKKKFNDIEINLYVQKMPTYISKKISQLNFVPKPREDNLNQEELDEHSIHSEPSGEQELTNQKTISVSTDKVDRLSIALADDSSDTTNSIINEESMSPNLLTY